jgi:hypothetical protein
MKRAISFITLVLISNLSFSQDFEFAIIQDKDGFSNVREEPNLKSKIVGNIKNNEIIFVFDHEESNNMYSFQSASISGFVHNSRIKRLTKLKDIKPSNQIENNIRFKHNNFEIDIFAEKFDAKKYSVQRNKQGFVEKLNNKIFYGTDGDLPKVALKSVVFKVNNKVISIDKNQVNDLFEPNFDNTKVFFDASTQIIYLTMNNSDGAGSYAVAWTFKPNETPKRFVLINF